MIDTIEEMGTVLELNLEELEEVVGGCEPGGDATGEPWEYNNCV